MASGDGVVQALPTFLGRTPLWEPNMMLGYPLFADPNQAFWYPVLRIMRAIPHGFNAYVVFAYVVAAVGATGFARRISGSTAGGIAAGLTFGLGGFMISHEGHLNLIQPAAWTPYVLWAIEELRHGARAVTVSLGAIAIALSATSGTQQPLVYILFIGIVYTIVFVRREWPQVALMIVLGAGLSAIAIVPAAELTLQSSRAHQSYADYLAFYTNAWEFIVRMFAPYYSGTIGMFTEASNYAGIVPPLLGIVALVRGRDSRQVWFWWGVALWAAWMSAGDALFGPRVAYHIPIYSLFRIPSRHALDFTLAFGVLAALGIAGIKRWPLRQGFVAAVALNMLAFAWFGYWRSGAVSISNLTPSPEVVALRSRLGGNYRMLAPLGSSNAQTLPPNLSVLWGVPSIGGYVSLEDRRVAHFLQMDPTGEVATPSIPSLNLTGMRYMLFPTSDKLDGFIGADPLTSNKSLAYAIPPMRANAIEMVSALGDSVSIANNMPVAEIAVTDIANRIYTMPILAGRDTSESAYERPDVRSQIRHNEAKVYSGDTDAHLFVSHWSIPTKSPLTRVAIHWRYSDPVHGALSVVHLTLINITQNRTYAVGPIDRYYADGWRRAGSLDGDTVLEDQQAMPAAWVVSSVRATAGDDAQIAALQSAQFKPRNEAITSDEAGYRERKTSGNVLVTKSDPDERAYAVTCAQRCMLVLNELWYPGWRASMDSINAPVLRVDYLLRGIDVPSGSHVIRLWFAPRSLFVGEAISALSLLALAAFLVRDCRSGRVSVAWHRRMRIP